MKRASDFWIQLKDQPALNPNFIMTVDIVTESNGRFFFNLFMISGDHFEFEFPNVKAAKSARQSILLQTAKKRC